jgi:hypothetical protein
MKTKKFVVGNQFAVGKQLGVAKVSCAGYNFRCYTHNLVEEDGSTPEVIITPAGGRDYDSVIVARSGGIGKVIFSMRQIHSILLTCQRHNVKITYIFYILQKVKKVGGKKEFSYVTFHDVEIRESISDLQFFIRRGSDHYVLRVVCATLDKSRWVLDARPVDTEQCEIGDLVLSRM